MLSVMHDYILVLHLLVQIHICSLHLCSIPGIEPIQLQSELTDLLCSLMNQRERHGNAGDDPIYWEASLITMDRALDVVETGDRSMLQHGSANLTSQL